MHLTLSMFCSILFHYYEYLHRDVGQGVSWLLIYSLILNTWMCFSEIYNKCLILFIPVILALFWRNAALLQFPYHLGRFFCQRMTYKYSNNNNCCWKKRLGISTQCPILHMTGQKVSVPQMILNHPPLLGRLLLSASHHCQESTLHGPYSTFVALCVAHSSHWF